MNIESVIKKSFVDNLMKSWEGKTLHDIFFPDMWKVNKIPSNMRQIVVGEILCVYRSQDSLCVIYDSISKHNTLNLHFTITNYNQINFYLTLKVSTTGYTDMVVEELDITKMVYDQKDLV